MSARSYPVTTIGELAPPSSSSCACTTTTPATPPRTMRGLEDLGVLYNPIAWAAEKLIGAGLAHATGTDDTTKPGALDRLAAAFGVDPVELAIELTGYSGVGRYWPAMQIVGGAAALGGAAYLAARAINKRRSKRKAKRG